MLNAIDARRGAGGIFGGALEHDLPAEAQRIPDGQAVCADELAAAYALLESLTDTAAPMSAPMLAIRECLEGVKARLARALETGAAADADEVQAAQRELDEVDAARLAHGGVFAGDVAKGAVPAGQATLSALLNPCYGASVLMDAAMFDFLAEACASRPGQGDPDARRAVKRPPRREHLPSTRRARGRRRVRNVRSRACVHYRACARPLDALVFTARRRRGC